MKLIDKLNSINKPEVKKLEVGDYNDIAEFWNKVIVPNLPDKKTIQDYHKLLKDYINMDNPTLAMRAHYEESNGHENLRRGWMNRINIDGKQYEFFYTDNFFAQYFSKMAHDNYHIDINDFYDTMKSREFPFRYKFTLCEEEKEKLSFKEGKNPGINGNTGYYLAHILDTGKHYTFGGSEFGTKYIEENYFTCGKRSDYIEENDKFGKAFVRDFGVKDETYRKILVASFIRFTHPINNFICPNKNSCKYDLPYKRAIGETPELLAYAHNYFLNNFPKEYNEFLELALAPDYYKNEFEFINNPVKIHCEIDCNKKSKLNTSPQPTAPKGPKTSQPPKVKTLTVTSHKSLSDANLLERNQIIDNLLKNYNVKYNLKNKLGQLIVSIIWTLNNTGKLTNADMDMLTSNDSKLKFGGAYKVAVELNKDVYDEKRYLKKSQFSFNGHDYIITNDWYEYDNVYKKIVDWGLSKGLKLL